MTIRKFWVIYGEERDKLSEMPDADDDFIALETAIDRYETEHNRTVVFGIDGAFTIKKED